MYYAIHQYLAQQGYVILTPDYRGSSGYDRSWATGNYLDLGGDDMRDVVSASLSSARRVLLFVSAPSVTSGMASQAA